jgi:hypothetical protein
MPRICGREGCGNRLSRSDGTPDYRRHFCSSQCKNADKREKMQSRRARLRTEKCPTCGRKPNQDGCVPRHKALGGLAQSAGE